MPAIGKFVDSLRPLSAGVVAAARQLSTRRLLATAVVAVALVAIAVLVRLPTAVELRDRAASLGSWFPLAFLVAHIAVTVLPFPRTAFTLAAGLLFGPLLGITLAVTASTVSAVIAVALVRAAGWRLDRLVRDDSVDRLNGRMRERGWVAVMSLRLIPVVPFAPLNYVAGASGVGLMPFTMATIAGLLPGTSAVVVLGDALTGHVSGLLFLISAGTGLFGLALFAYEVRQHRRRRTTTLSHVDFRADEADSK